MQLSHKIAEFIGYDLIKTSRNVLLHRHLRNLFTLVQTDCVLDVGANHGQYGRMLRSLGYKGRIISFEPVSSSFEKLKLTAGRDRKWEIHPYALGAKEESKKIHLTAASDFASFLPPSDFSRQTFGKAVTINGEEQVRIKKLDDIWTSLMAGKPARSIHLKMDTQGYDLEVMRGGTSVLPQITSLQSELSVLPVYDGMPDYLEALAGFRRQGFTVTGLFPVSHDGASLAVIEFDCVCRRALAKNS